MKITFVRHTSVDVPPGVCYGQTDVEVRETFTEEAAKVKGNIGTLISETGKDFDAIYSSPLSRCRKLAEFCGYPEAVSDKRLLEMNFGEWEMKRYDEIKDPRLQQWYDDWVNVAAPGGESFNDQTNRVRSFLEEMKKSGNENILVFCHAGIIMNALLLTDKSDLSTLFSSQPPYGSLTGITL